MMIMMNIMLIMKKLMMLKDSEDNDMKIIKIIIMKIIMIMIMTFKIIMIIVIIIKITMTKNMVKNIVIIKCDSNMLTKYDMFIHESIISSSHHLIINVGEKIFE